MSIILRMLLPEVLALLQATIKNPKSLAAEMVILIEIRDLLNGIISSNTLPQAP